MLERVGEPRLQRRHQYQEMCGAGEETLGADAIQLCRAAYQGRSVQVAEDDSSGPVKIGRKAPARWYEFIQHGREKVFVSLSVCESCVALLTGAWLLSCKVARFRSTASYGVGRRLLKGGLFAASGPGSCRGVEAVAPGRCGRRTRARRTHDWCNLVEQTAQEPQATTKGCCGRR